MNRKKILWISHLIPYPPKGGVMMRSYHLLRELARHHDVSLFAINQKRLFASFFPDRDAGLAEVAADIGAFAKIVDVVDEPAGSSAAARAWLALRSLVGLPYTVRCLWSREIDRRLRQCIAAESFDVLHFDTIGLAAYWHADYRIPAVLDHHNVESHMMLRRAQVEKSPAKKVYFYQEGKRLEAYERKMLPNFKHHFVCSSDDANRLATLDSSLNISVVPNGIALEESLPPRAPDPEQPKLLFIGGLSWYPNHDAVMFLLDEIWPKIIAKAPNARLDIIGRAPSANLQRLAAASRGVHLHGFVDDIRPFYEQASLYICPIRDGGGTKLKVLDALAHRVPLVAHEIACEGIEAVHGVHVLKATGVEELAAQVEAVLKAPVDAQAMADAGYALVEARYEYQAIGRQLAGIFSTLQAREGDVACGAPSAG